MGNHNSFVAAYEALKEVTDISKALAANEIELTAMLGARAFDSLNDAVFAYAHEYRFRLLTTPAENAAQLAIKLAEVRQSELKDTDIFDDAIAHIEQDAAMLAAQGGAA